MFIPDGHGPVNVLCGKGTFNDFISDNRVGTEVDECDDYHINEYEKKEYRTNTEIMTFGEPSDIVGIVIAHKNQHIKCPG